MRRQFLVHELINLSTSLSIPPLSLFISIYLNKNRNMDEASMYSCIVEVEAYNLYTQKLRNRESKELNIRCQKTHCVQYYSPYI